MSRWTGQDFRGSSSAPSTDKERAKREFDVVPSWQLRMHPGGFLEAEDQRILKGDASLSVDGFINDELQRVTSRGVIWRKGLGLCESACELAS